jgi:hypothetical protein
MPLRLKSDRSLSPHEGTAAKAASGRWCRLARSLLRPGQSECTLAPLIFLLSIFPTSGAYFGFISKIPEAREKKASNSAKKLT